MNPAPMRIIIVEDEAAHVEAIRRALEDAGTAAEIGVAATLQEYRESIAIDPPDIALMDLNLPDGRAVEVLSFPPEDGPFPILIMTSYGNERIAVEAMKAGALDYVVKSPGAFAVMPQTLARARREWKALQERKQAEVELQKAKQDWESIFQGIPHPTVILDPQQRILAGNRILEQLLGKSLLEIQGHKCWEIFHSPQAQGPPPGCPFERTVGSAADETVEMEIEALGGVFLVSCTPVYDGQGRLDKVIHVATDITERKRAEEVLRIGEQRFRKLYHETPIMLHSLDPDGRLERVNDYWLEQMGYERREVIGQLWVDFLTKNSVRYAQQEVMPRFFADGIVKDVPYQVKCKDGRVMDVLLSASSERDENGQMIRSLAAMKDITKRVQAEQRVRESEERFRMIFQHSPVGMAIATLDGTLLRANQAYCEMFGYLEEELLRMRFYDFTHPDDREMNREQIAGLIAGETDAVHFEKRFLRKDSGIVWASVHVTAIRDSAGKPLFLTGQVLDITEGKRAQERIEHLNRVLSAIRDVTQLIVREKEPQRLIGQTCRLLVETRGYDSALIILADASGVPRSHAEAGLGEVLQPLVESLQRGVLPPHCEEARLRSGLHVVSDRTDACALSPMTAQSPAGDAMCIRLQHGEQIYGYMMVTVSPRHSQDAEEQLLFAEMAEDIAFALHNIEREQEATRAEEGRRRAEVQLRQTQKMEALGTLAGGIAHDFNNILGIIFGYTEMAHLDAAQGSHLQANLQEVLKAATRAKELVKQILAFSRQSEQERKPVPIGLIVKEALRMLRASLPTTISIQSEVTTSTTVMADPTQIHQVLMNLCTNAAHAMRDRGGKLQVNLTEAFVGSDSVSPSIDLPPGPYVRLTVMDTGHGIDPAIVDRIFDPFFTTKGTGVGTGLGLAVVHGIVTAHGGAIEVESSPGIGTAFQVYFPAVESVPSTETDPLTTFPTGHERVLFVDDEPGLITIAKSMLERLGYEVECRTSSVEALEAFRRQPREKPFDLVITDMTMPHMTGAELAKELHRLQPGLPIIVCTGFSEKMNAEKARALGIQGFLMKPMIMTEIAEMIRNVLSEERQK